MNVGVVGATGFIGKHLCLGLVQNDRYVLSEIDKDHCRDVGSLRKKTNDIDVLVVAGGVNRADSEDTVYTENIEMVKIIIATLTAQNYKGRLIFLSSIQNDRDNAYGRAKRDSEKLLKDFAHKQGVALHILVLPNIFGESQKPYYNCVVPTFVQQILQEEQSQIADAEVELLHVRHVVALIKNLLSDSDDVSDSNVRLAGETIQVKDLHQTLVHFASCQGAKNFIIPNFSSVLYLDLYNTFRYSYWTLCGSASDNYASYEDERGYLIELVKTDSPGQVFFSTTKPGFVRGGHFHTRKIERFCLLSGQSKVAVESVFGDFSYTIDCSGQNGTFVNIPNYAMHKMENVGQEEVIGVFWINEIFNPDDGDVYVKLLK